MNDKTFKWHSHPSNRMDMFYISRSRDSDTALHQNSMQDMHKYENLLKREQKTHVKFVNVLH